MKSDVEIASNYFKTKGISPQIFGKRLPFENLLDPKFYEIGSSKVFKPLQAVRYLDDVCNSFKKFGSRSIFF